MTKKRLTLCAGADPAIASLYAIMAPSTPRTAARQRQYDAAVADLLVGRGEPPEVAKRHGVATADLRQAYRLALKAQAASR